MKEKLKFIGVFLLALALGINTLNVSAVDPDNDDVCGEGEILHTNYYLFLDVGSKSTYLNADHVGNATGTWHHYTEAPKFNNISGNISTLPSGVYHGNVAITNVNESLSNRPNNEEITWDAVEYWEHLYDTSVYVKEKKVVNRSYSPDPRTTYFLHNGDWRTYEPNSEIRPWTNQELFSEPTNSSVTTGLIGYIKANKSNLANSGLVKSGTAYPETTITDHIDPFLATTYFAFRVDRTYTAQTIEDSPGFTLESKTGQIYSPAVSYYQFCMKDESKTIQYDQNYEGNAPVNMPEDSVFYNTCGDISDKIPEREGYKFLGWSTDKDADKPAMVAGTEVQKYAPGEQYCGNSIKLYAIWKAEDAEEPATDEFTVTYDANKGTNAPAPQSGSVSDKKCVKISDQGKMTLAKNKFLGWSTKEDAAEADEKYAPGTEYCGENGDLTLYAIWNASTGVSAHVIAFAFVAVSAVAALVVAKKKNLFKQI